MISRRDVLTGLVLAGSGVFGRKALADDQDRDLTDKLPDLEARHGGRLGVAILDTGSGKLVTHRGDERFAMCSTSKFPVTAFILARVDQGRENLERRVIYGKGDLVPHSPATQAHADGSGMTIGELCAAAMTTSDNTAMNLLLDSFGGPAELTAWLRSIGDDVTRLDRREPDLNDAIEGDPRDTTSPAAMLNVLNRMCLGELLSAESRARLIGWMVACETGGKRLRAGLPEVWHGADKTGTGNHATASDIAVFWGPGRTPILVSAYYTQFDASDDQRDAVFSEIGRLATTV